VGEYYLISEADLIQLRTSRLSNTVTNDHYITGPHMYNIPTRQQLKKRLLLTSLFFRSY